MRYSVRSILLLCTVVAVGAAMAAAFTRLDKWIQRDLLWIVGSVGSVGVVGVIMATGTAIGWMAAWRTPLLPANLWPGFVFSVPNWGFFALVRYSLHLTAQWDYDQDKVGGLLSLERLASSHLFDYIGVEFQLANLLSVRSRHP
jgi:hypothetical protein